jgi:hypothetical protein
MPRIVRYVPLPRGFLALKPPLKTGGFEPLSLIAMARFVSASICVSVQFWADGRP